MGGLSSVEMSSSSSSSSSSPESPSSSSGVPVSTNNSTSSDSDSNAMIDSELVLIHTLVHVATVQLFHPFAQKDAGAHAKCLGAARAVTALLRLVLLSVDVDADVVVGALDPIMGTCCMCAVGRVHSREDAVGVVVVVVIRTSVAVIC